MPFEILNPSPVPCPTCFVVKNGWPTLSLNCFAIPFPLSITEISTSEPTFFTSTSTHFSGNGSTASTALKAATPSPTPYPHPPPDPNTNYLTLRSSGFTPLLFLLSSLSFTSLRVAATFRSPSLPPICQHPRQTPAPNLRETQCPQSLCVIFLLFFFLILAVTRHALANPSRRPAA